MWLPFIVLSITVIRTYDMYIHKQNMFISIQILHKVSTQLCIQNIIIVHKSVWFSVLPDANWNIKILTSASLWSNFEDAVLILAIKYSTSFLVSINSDRICFGLRDLPLKAKLNRFNEFNWRGLLKRDSSKLS